MAQTPREVETRHAGDASTEARVRDTLAQVFARKTMAQWTEHFAGSDACVTPVLRLSEAMEHPQFVARGMVVDGMQLGGALRISGVAAQAPRAAPAAGSGTDEVLRDLGLGADEIAGLRARRIVG